MGSGTWTSASYNTYTKSTRGVDFATFSNTIYSAQEMYVSRSLAPVLYPYGVIRKCHDSEEHPDTLPVILALDVTGSMGDASVKVAKKLNEIMTDLYADKSIKDIEFCIMGIGDLSYDDAPIQMSQFESDVRIAEQLDKIYFEAGGGGNKFESYTAAWYMGVNHCELHCWDRGKKGIIITMGDEGPNPYLPKLGLSNVTGDKLQNDVETKDLYPEVIEKYDVYHISVDDRSSSYQYHKTHNGIDEKWRELLGENYFVSSLDNLAQTITNIIKDREANTVWSTTIASSPGLQVNENNEVTW
jgi:hypothetical protein